MLRLGTADRSARQIRSISGAKERLAAAYGTQQQQQQQQQPQRQTPQQQPIQQQHSKGDEVLMTMAVRSFAVGNLCSRQAYPVFFYADRAEYSFYHPYEPTEIRMIMYYRDMIQVSLQGLRFSFRVPNQLRAFKGDYDPSNPLHLITIQVRVPWQRREIEFPPSLPPSLSPSLPPFHLISTTHIHTTNPFLLLLLVSFSQLTTANSGSEVRARIFPLIPGYRGKANGNQQQLMSGGGGARRRLSSF
jgi:hypothetical protein